MVAVPISRTGESRYPQPPAASPEAAAAQLAPLSPSSDITQYVAAGTLLAGGALIATGHRRAGLAVAAAGTALALLEEQEAVKEWWKNLPGYLTEAQNFLDKLEGYLKEATLQGQRLQGILRRS